MFGVVSGETIAQIRNSATCPNGKLDPKTVDLPTLIACINKFKERPEIPIGAVVAFDHRDGCPKVGWQEFKAAAGRFIIGIDGKKYQLPYVGTEPQYSIGGLKEISLDVTHMPNHGHRISTGFLPGSWDHDGLAGGSSNDGIDLNFNDPNPRRDRTGGHGIHPNVLEKTGGLPGGSTKPVNNMPPYIALYFCKKTNETK